MQSKNINSIVLLRAIAALGVCFVHINKSTDFKFGRIIDRLLDGGQQGVTVFFVISGFILPYSLYKNQYEIKDFFTFLFKRSLRVDPPYWCAIILAFILIPLPVSLLSLKSIFFHITYLVPFVKSVHWYTGIYWTLSIEFQFYILLGLSYPFLKKLPDYLSIIILILVAAPFIRNDADGLIPSKLYLFVFGYLTFMAYVDLISLKKFIIVTCLFTGWAIVEKSMMTGIVPVCTVFFIMIYKSNKKIPALNFLGNISYSLYLVHIPATALLLRALSGYHILPVVLFALCVMNAVILAYVLNRLIEVPALRLSKKIHFKKPDPIPLVNSN